MDTGALHVSPPLLVTVTVPLKVPTAAWTENATDTDWPTAEGSGSSETIAVVVGTSETTTGCDTTGV